jgi:hypothetical protein
MRFSNKEAKDGSMKKGKLTILALGCCAVFAVITSIGCNNNPGPTSGTAETAPKMKMTTDIPPQITTPDSVETRIGTLKFFDGAPDKATAEKAYDNLDFMRGVQVFLNTMPGASLVAMRDGLRSVGAVDGTVGIFETLMDSKSLWLRANTETVYASTWLDLKNGPIVIESPPNVLGVLDDFWFHYVADLGKAGPDKGKGANSSYCRQATPGRYPRATSSPNPTLSMFGS